MNPLIDVLRATAQARDLDRKIGSGAWGLFFTWAAVALLGNMGWGPGLIGVGLITFGAQAARRYVDLPVEPLWLVIGVLFTTGGVWKSLDAKVNVVPVVFIAAGIALLVAAMDDGRDPARRRDVSGGEARSSSRV